MLTAEASNCSPVRQQQKDPPPLPEAGLLGLADFANLPGSEFTRRNPLRCVDGPAGSVSAASKATCIAMID